MCFKCTCFTFDVKETIYAKVKSTVKFKPTGKQLRNACARKRGKRFNQREGPIFTILTIRFLIFYVKGAPLLNST